VAKCEKAEMQRQAERSKGTRRTGLMNCTQAISRLGFIMTPNLANPAAPRMVELVDGPFKTAKVLIEANKADCLVGPYTVVDEQDHSINIARYVDCRDGTARHADSLRL
jgi:hypothetical protein